MLLISNTDHATIKVADFGFARRVHTPESLTSRVGTPSYVAPEVGYRGVYRSERFLHLTYRAFLVWIQVLKNLPHDQRVDLWSVGVVIFVLLVGYPPFVDKHHTSLFEKIRNGDWIFCEEDWRNISNDAKELISGLLVVDPVDRWSIDDCLRSAWIKEDERNLSADLTDSLVTLRTKESHVRSLAQVFIGMGVETESTDAATQAQIPISDLFKPPSSD